MSIGAAEAAITATAPSPRTACSRCGAPARGRRLACEYCGASFAGGLQADPVHEATVLFVRSLQKENEELLSAPLLISLIAFFVVPILLLFGLLWLGAGWLVGLIVAAVSVPVLFITVGYVDEKEQQRLFARRLLPQIRRFLARHDLSSAELIAVARQELDEDSDLLHMLSRI